MFGIVIHTVFVSHKVGSLTEHHYWTPRGEAQDDPHDHHSHHQEP